ncbi:MAG: hypothetical protein P1U81_12720, partial [Verrucomicrobiales bacterium]|nr:hypothetical protein [Verrucomicrobiales bacterium]
GASGTRNPEGRLPRRPRCHGRYTSAVYPPRTGWNRSLQVHPEREIRRDDFHVVRVAPAAKSGGGDPSATAFRMKTRDSPP